MGRKPKNHRRAPRHTPEQRKNQRKNRGRRDYESLSWKSELFRMRIQLKHYGLQVIEISGDGNCMFKAISDQIEGNQANHMFYREQAVAFLIENREEYELFIEDDIPFDRYVESMSRSGTWGGHLELQAISLVLNVNIKIHRCGEPIWEIINFPFETRTIHLSYHNGDHYNSVRLISDPGEGPALPIPNQLQIVDSVEEYDNMAWNDIVEYVSLLSNFGDLQVIKRVLQKMYPNDPPTVDVVNDNCGKIIDVLAGELEKEEEGKEVKEVQAPKAKKTIIVSESRPAKLPRNNDKCWCGTNRKYKNCCKAKDAFREPEPEVLAQSLSSVRI